MRILVEPKNALTKQYSVLLGLENVELEIEDAALEVVAQKAIDRRIGARGLRAVMEEVMTDIMFRIPSDLSIKKVCITADSVDGGAPKIVRDIANPRKKIGTK